MRAFLALLNVNFKSLLMNTANTRRRNKRKSVSGFGAIALIAIIMVYVSGTWSITLSAVLGPVGGLDIMLSIMLILGLLMALFFTIYGAQGTLFSTKDADLVLSLPVPTVYIMLARLMALYIEIALIVECILIPAGVVWLWQGGGGGAGFLVLLIVMGLVAALVPALITLVFGYLISLLISRMRHKNLFNIIFSLLFAMVIFAMVFGMNNGMEMIAADVDGVRQMLFSALPPLGWFIRAVTGPNLLYILLLVAVCVVPFLVVSWLFSLNFKSLLTRLASHTLRSDYKIGAVGASGSLAALLKKEARRFFGTPMYFMNTGMGAILLIIGSVVVFFLRGTILEVFGSLPGGAGGMLSQFLQPVFLAVMAFLLLTIMPSSVSLSLEGKTLWILKEAPVSTGRIFFAKAGFSAFVGIVAVLVSVPLVSITFGFSFAGAAGILLISLLFAVHAGMLGLYVNLRMPRLDFENETIVIKQSASVIVSMLFGLLTGLILVGVYFLMHFLGAGFELFCLVGIIVLAAINLLLYQRLNTKGRRLFAEL